jgi:hypothetical protein
MDQYSEEELVRKAKGIQLKQLPGMKGFLYNLLLDSLRISKKEQSIDLQLHQLMEHAKILYDKGLPVSALKVLKKLKELALHYHQVSFAFQALLMEKKIDMMLGNCQQEEIHSLNREMNEYSQQLSMIGVLSNTSMLLYGWHTRYGCIRNKEDEKVINEIYQSCLSIKEDALSFYPKLYWLQAKTYYHLITKEDQLFYDAACECNELFSLYPEMKKVEALQYQRAAAYLSEAALLLHHTTTLNRCAASLKNSEGFYLLIAKLNISLACKEYDEQLLRQTFETISSLKNEERKIILCYKAALLCVNNHQFERAVDFTHTGINSKSNSRLDLQYQLRLMHSRAHKKIGNEELSESLMASIRRFKKNNNL